MTAKIDFATVVFRAEIGLLRLLARSLARFMPPDHVGEILLIPNDVEVPACIARLKEIRI